MKEFPSIRYRPRDGKIEKCLFESAPPPGWLDSPADLSVSDETPIVWVVEEVIWADELDVSYPRKRGRPKGSKNK